MVQLSPDVWIQPPRPQPQQQEVHSISSVVGQCAANRQSELGEIYREQGNFVSAIAAPFLSLHDYTF